MNARRIVQVRTSVPTLDFERAPILGADRRHAYRAKQLRRMLACVALFWLIVIAIIGWVVR